MEDWKLEERLRHQDPSLTLRNMEKIRDLRILLGDTQAKLRKLQKDYTANEELVSQERIILEGTQEEIKKLERIALNKEFGI